MRSTDEHFSEIMKRAAVIKEKQILRRKLVIESVSACACIFFLVLTAFSLPRITDGADLNSQTHYGSLILQVSYMGYVIVGLLAFILGILVTLLCIHWKKMKQKEREPK